MRYLIISLSNKKKLMGKLKLIKIIKKFIEVA